MFDTGYVFLLRKELKDLWDNGFTEILSIPALPFLLLYEPEQSTTREHEEDSDAGWIFGDLPLAHFCWDIIQIPCPHPVVLIIWPPHAVNEELIRRGEVQKVFTCPFTQVIGKP